MFSYDAKHENEIKNWDNKIRYNIFSFLIFCEKVRKVWIEINEHVERVVFSRLYSYFWSVIALIYFFKKSLTNFEEVLGAN